MNARFLLLSAARSKGENGLAVRGSRAHFRLYSEFRSAIKSRPMGEKNQNYRDLVRLYNTARNHFAIEPENK